MGDVGMRLVGVLLGLTSAGLPLGLLDPVVVFRDVVFSRGVDFGRDDGIEDFMADFLASVLVVVFDAIFVSVLLSFPVFFSTFSNSGSVAWLSSMVKVASLDTVPPALSLTG